MARILLTGFEPFGQNPDNVSQIILARMETSFVVSDPWERGQGENTKFAPVKVEVEKQLLTVDKPGSLMVAKRVLNGENWDAIIHMGLCEMCESVRFETRAQNILDMRIPDNAGRQVKNQLIGEHYLSCNPTMVSAMSFPELESIEISTDAGTFLCNETYYRTLEAISHKTINQNLPACFIHFPRATKLSVESSIKCLKEVIARLLFKPVIDVAGALIIDRNRFLLARRNSESEMPGLWEFPGGKIERNESAKSAISRELMEEFGVKFDAIQVVGKHYHEYPRFCINLNLVQVSGDAAQIFDNQLLWSSHDEVSWFSNLKGVNIAPADEMLARLVISRINAK